MIGERIEAVRTAAGMTRAELAEACAINTKTLGTYERGSRSPDPALIAKICEVLDVSADYLLGLSDQPDRPAAEPDLRPEQLSDAAQISRTIYSIAKLDKNAPHARNCLPVIRDIVDDLQELQIKSGILYDEIREQHPAFELNDLNDPEERRRIKVKARLQDPEALAFTEGEEAFMLQLRQLINEAAGMVADRIIVDLGDQLSNNIE